MEQINPVLVPRQELDADGMFLWVQDATRAINALVEAHRQKCKLETALREIRDEQGAVCGEFTECSHAACQSSYASWQIADAALRGEEEE